MKSETRITVMTAADALRAYNRFVDHWPWMGWSIPSFVEWKNHKNIHIAVDEDKKP